MRALVFSANPPGLIAFVGKRAAGWCAVGPREEYPQYEGGSDEGVWAIPSYRWTKPFVAVASLECLSRQRSNTQRHEVLR
jgi:hypothetical protein